MEKHYYRSFPTLDELLALPLFVCTASKWRELGAAFVATSLSEWFSELWLGRRALVDGTNGGHRSQMVVLQRLSAVIDESAVDVGPIRLILYK